MILMLLGTNPYPFSRLFRVVEEWARSAGIHVIAQTGHTIAKSEVIECYEFAPHEKIIEWIKQAEFVICQGGFGSLKDCLAHSKKVIAVPRYIHFNECQDNQEELVRALANNKRVIPLYDMTQFEECVRAIENFVPTVSLQSAIPELVQSIIESYTVDK